MGLKECEKCSEMVDDAKAFCPGCGNAFVEEETRKEESGFERMDSTVQFGQTMYNQMLSDMGLNISKSPNASEKRIEVVAPVETTAKPQSAPPVEPQPAKPAFPSYLKWILAGAIALIILFALVLAVIIAALIYWPNLRNF